MTHFESPYLWAPDLGAMRRSVEPEVVERLLFVGDVLSFSGSWISLGASIKGMPPSETAWVWKNGNLDHV